MIYTTDEVLPSQTPAQLLRWPGRTPQACSEFMARSDAISHDRSFADLSLRDSFCGIVVEACVSYVARRLISRGLRRVSDTPEYNGSKPRRITLRRRYNYLIKQLQSRSALKYPARAPIAQHVSSE